MPATPHTYGHIGHPALVTPLPSTPLFRSYRDNDDPNLPWNGPATFATDQGLVDAVSLIQSNFSTQRPTPGVNAVAHLAGPARIARTLEYFFRDCVPFSWRRPTPIYGGVRG